MNMYAMHTTAAALFALSAFASSAQDPAWVADARKVAGSVPPKLIAVLNDEIAKGGPEGAIAVCRDKAPELAKAASAESGWAIRRVSLKNRNPTAVPDAWERAALEDFDRRAAGGESPATIEKAEVVVVDGKETYRYMKALPVQPLCVACHGSAEQLSPALKEKLKAVYPDDKGVGYSPGQIRGAITLKKPV
jgi:mono/diheme cytochrome c family protein